MGAATIVLFSVILGSADTSGACTALAQRTQAFLGALNADARAAATAPFNDEARITWSYFPIERRGLALRDMDETQRALALEVLRAALSASGFEKVEQIRSLEAVLAPGNPQYDVGRYFLCVFGEPSAERPWGLRWEGHHVSLNWTMIDGKVLASTPQFLGANPAEVREGEFKGLRPLAAEEDLARTLVTSLNEVQRAAAVMGDEAPPEILTGMQREAAIQENRGVAYPELTAEQQGLLLSLIDVYAAVQRPEVAQARLERLRAAGLDAVKFGWMGGLEPGQGHYYRIQGPTFLIEYDNTQNNANHIHTVWRDFEGDFGRDLLKDHYRTHADPAHPHTHEHE